MKLLVLGAGGVGGYFGGRLAAAGADVTFLVRPGRREQLRRDGLRVTSLRGDISMPVQTVTADELKPGYDFVFLTCKAYDFDSAADAITPAMNGTCAVIPMLNGMSHLDRLDERFGAAQVMGGACLVNVSMRPDGVIQHLDMVQKLIFGERDRTKSARAQRFADALAKSIIDWELADDIVQSMWEKAVMLTTIAVSTVLFRANVGEILIAPGGKAAMLRTLDANVAVATHEGHPPRPASVEFSHAVLTNTESRMTASMLRDLEAGGAVESDHIVGFMLDCARRHGIDDTMLSLAFTHLKSYEARRAAGRVAPVSVSR